MSRHQDAPVVPRDQLRAAAEAILVVADEPVPTSALAEALGLDEPAATGLMEDLAAEYRGRAPGARVHGFVLRRAAGGWRLASAPNLKIGRASCRGRV